MAKENNRGLKQRVRTSYVISTISIALVLFILGATFYLIMNAMAASDKMKESFMMHVMLKSDVSEDKTKEIGDKIAKIEGVKLVSFISKDAAAKDFKKYIGSDFVDFLSYNPLPHSFEVGLSSKNSTKEVLDDIEKRIKAIVGVEEIVYQKGVVEQMNINIRKFNTILSLFGLTLLIISVTLLNNTIRVAIYSKRYIINTMKLVGATRWFILRPFLLSALLQGIYSAVIGGLIFMIMVVGINQSLPDVTFAGDTRQLTMILIAMLFGGVIISVSFTLLGVNKFIRSNSSQVHFY